MQSSLLWRRQNKVEVRKHGAFETGLQESLSGAMSFERSLRQWEGVGAWRESHSRVLASTRRFDDH